MKQLLISCLIPLLLCFLLEYYPEMHTYDEGPTRVKYTIIIIIIIIMLNYHTCYTVYVSIFFKKNGATKKTLIYILYKHTPPTMVVNHNLLFVVVELNYKFTCTTCNNHVGQYAAKIFLIGFHAGCPASLKRAQSCNYCRYVFSFNITLTTHFLHLFLQHLPPPKFYFYFYLVHVS